MRLRAVGMGCRECVASADSFCFYSSLVDGCWFGGRGGATVKLVMWRFTCGTNAKFRRLPRLLRQVAWNEM